MWEFGTRGIEATAMNPARKLRQTDRQTEREREREREGEREKKMCSSDARHAVGMQVPR